MYSAVSPDIQNLILWSVPDSRDNVPTSLVVVKNETEEIYTGARGHSEFPSISFNLEAKAKFIFNAYGIAFSALSLTW